MSDAALPPFLDARSAFAAFARSAMTQDQRHIKPLHKHFALRLVIEGGFLPHEVTPRPPLRVNVRRGRTELLFDATAENYSERTVLGGLKTKDIDIVVEKAGVGPVVAISVKGTTGAFRNLTNRMEEAIGDSTNLHIMYPGLVYGFFQIIRANRAAEGLAPNDIAIQATGEVATSIRRYHDVLLELSGRRFVRDDFTRYESVGFALVETEGEHLGELTSSFPPSESPLRPDTFFSRILQTYDLRYPYIAASLPALKRAIWPRSSPALVALGSEEQWASRLGYMPRVD